MGIGLSIVYIAVRALLEVTRADECFVEPAWECKRIIVVTPLGEVIVER